MALVFIYAIGYALPVILVKGVHVRVDIVAILLTALPLWLLWRWSWGNLLTHHQGPGGRHATL